MDPTSELQLLSDYDDFANRTDELFSGVEDFAIAENMELKRWIQDQDTKIAEQELIIKQLQQRINAMESAILWCGEQCFDEMASDSNSKFKKIE